MASILRSWLRKLESDLAAADSAGLSRRKPGQIDSEGSVRRLRKLKQSLLRIISFNQLDFSPFKSSRVYLLTGKSCVSIFKQ